MKIITSVLLLCIAFQANAQKAQHGQQLLDSLKKNYSFNKQPALKKKD